MYERAAASFSTAPGYWFGFVFDDDFDYDGVANLLWEVQWDSDSGGHAYTSGTARTARHVYCYNTYGPHVENKLHYMRIHVTATGFTPTSLGRMKALYR